MVILGENEMATQMIKDLEEAGIDPEKYLNIFHVCPNCDRRFLSAKGLTYHSEKICKPTRVWDSKQW